MRTSLFLAATALFALSAPAIALTLEQAQAEIAGMYCVGSICTSQELGTETHIVTEDLGDGIRHTPACGPWETTIAVGGQPVCVFVGVNSNYSSSTFTSPTCTLVTKELVYNGPYTDRAGAWSVNTSTAAC